MNAFDVYLSKYLLEGEDYIKIIPEIQRLESLDDLHDLNLSRSDDLGDILFVRYEALAPELFPHVRQRLIDSGMAKRHNVLSTGRRNKNTPDETYNVRMGFYGKRLQISLTVRQK